MKHLLQCVALLLALAIRPVDSMVLSGKYLKHKRRIHEINRGVYHRRCAIHAPQERDLVGIAQAGMPTSVGSLTSADDFVVDQ